MGMKDPIVGVVGQLQFEVFNIGWLYGADIIVDKLHIRACALVVASADPKSFD